MEFCGLTIETSSVVLKHGTIIIGYVVLTLKSVDRFLWCDHSNKTSLKELLHSHYSFFILQKYFFGGKRWGILNL